MSEKELLSYIDEYFTYHKDGYFLLKKLQNHNSKGIGQKAGCLKKGYWRISIKGKQYAAHRLIWLYHNKSYPKFVIDHINGDSTDNRIENLRDVTQKTNLQNLTKSKSNNKLGSLGVRVRGNKYLTGICIGGKSKHLGTFDTLELAELVYQEAKRKYHSGYTL